MKDLIKLIEEYPEFFGNCQDERDVVKVLDKQNTSREYRYLDRNGIGTFDINDNVEIEKCEGYDKCLGFYSVEFGIRNITSLRVYVEIYLEDYDEEEQRYSAEGLVEIGWDRY